MNEIKRQLTSDDIYTMTFVDDSEKKKQDDTVQTI
jgi:hypothetical protein